MEAVGGRVLLAWGVIFEVTYTGCAWVCGLAAGLLSIPVMQGGLYLLAYEWGRQASCRDIEYRMSQT